MITKHLAIIRHNNFADWLLLSGDNISWTPLSVVTALPSAVAGALEMLRRNPVDFSFSTRSPDQIAADPLCETPERLPSAVPGASIIVLLPEGRPGDPTAWSNVWRNPLQGLSCSGLSARFRIQTTPDQIEAYFRQEDLRSFGPEHPSERHDANRPKRPPHHRDLLVRHGDGWNARTLCPDAFPSLTALDAQRAKQYAVEQAGLELRAAKDPRAKRAKLQAQQAIDRAALENRRG